LPVRGVKPETDPVASAAVATEASARAAADTSETSARAAADTAETANRAAQDAILVAADSTEVTARANADTALANADAAEMTARQAAVTAEAAARDMAITTHAAVKRGVHGIPASVPAGQAVVGDGAGAFRTADLALPVGSLDAVGHSYPSALGVASGGAQNGYVDRVMRALGGVQRRRNFAVFGAIACWHSGNAAGDGGWAWVASQLVPPATVGSPPYEPQSNLAIAHYGLNDLGELGGTNPRPYQEAMRGILSNLCAAARAEDTDAAWTFTGTWSSGGTAGTTSNGAYKFTSTVGDKATLAIPAGYPGGLPVAIALTLGQTTYDYTITVKVDGVTVASGLRVQASALMHPNGKVNQFPLRLRPSGGGNSPFDIAAPQLASAGAHTIEVSLASVASGFLIVDYATIEADAADGPLVVVPNVNRPYSYAPWNASTHGPSAGTDPMNDASVAAFNTALASTVGEFAAALLVDIDTPLGKDVSLFTVALNGGGHPNNKGYAVIAQAIVDAVIANGALNSRRRSRGGQQSPAPWLPFGAAPSNAKAGQAFANSWVNYGSPYPTFAYYRDTQGRVHLRGAVKSGTAAGATIATLPLGCRPSSTIGFAGFSSTGALQRWTIDSSGNIAVATGGDTTRSEISGELIFTPDA
jgi:hypothetical protein